MIGVALKLRPFCAHLHVELGCAVWFYFALSFLLPARSFMPFLLIPPKFSLSFFLPPSHQTQHKVLAVGAVVDVHHGGGQRLFPATVEAVADGAA